MRVVKTHAVVAAVAFAIGATASASAVTLITGKQIKNGSVGLKDLSKQVRAKLGGTRSRAIRTRGSTPRAMGA